MVTDLNKIDNWKLQHKKACSSLHLSCLFWNMDCSCAAEAGTSLFSLFIGTGHSIYKIKPGSQKLKLILELEPLREEKNGKAI